MKKVLVSLSLLGALGWAATASAADLPMAAPVPVVPLVGYSFPPVIAQFGPATSYSTIICSNFTKLPDGTWKALAPIEFSLGFVQHIVPPFTPIKTGAFIYNNIDLWSQLETQCATVLVRARY